MRSQITPVVKYLLIINALLLVINNILPGLYLNNLMGVKYIFYNPALYPITLFTYMFAHGGFMHLFGNMLSLFFFGPLLESYWGGKRFLFFYIFCGVGAALIYSGIHFYEIKKLEDAQALYVSEPSHEYLLSFERKLGAPIFTEEFKNALDNDPENAMLAKQAEVEIDSIIDQIKSQPMVGASGAIFGILMAFAMLFPNTEMMLLFPPIPLKAKYFVFIYGAMEFYLGVARVPGDNVAHFAHLGGALFGFILVKYWQKQRNSFY